MIEIKLKPLSVNEAYTGKRYKTEKYKLYTLRTRQKLPRLDIPAGKLGINYVFCVSNEGADIDNPVKPFQDILQKKYGFNDSRIYRINIEKRVVKKGEEKILFEIFSI